MQTAASVALALALGILQWYEPDVLVSDLLKRFPKKEARNDHNSHFAPFHAPEKVEIRSPVANVAIYARFSVSG